MSETARTADTTRADTNRPDITRKVTDQTARSSQATLEGASRTVKDGINEAGQAARNATGQARELGQSITETVVETSSAATDLSTTAAEQTREVLMLGERIAADAGGKVADIGFGHSRRLMSSAAQAMDIYRDASERSAERVQALFSSAMTMSRGLQSMQHAWLELMDQRMGHAVHKPRDLLRCKNMVELAEVQRDFYIDAINHAFASTSRLLEIAGKTAQDAVRPLQSHHH